MGARSFKVQLQKTSIRYGKLLQKTFKAKQFMRTFKVLFLALIPTLLLLNSCANVNSNILFRIPRGDEFKFDSLPLKPSEDYKLGVGDRFSFLFGTNSGEKIILNQSGVITLNEGGNNNNALMNQQRNQFTYLVRQDGYANLPLIGEVKLSGLTIVDAENTLVDLLSKNYLNPFVQIRLVNQRVIIFPGKGDAMVVYLQNTNTSLLEALALAGGIREEGRANSVKLMRKTEKGREIYKIDLSTIEGLNDAQMIVQSNDYIYVDFKSRIASSILTEVAPWLSLITTGLLTYSIINPN